MPMDTGAPLQVPQQQQPSFSSAQSITMNPLLNYGQPQLGSGTPLMMREGGIARLGYQEGGEAMMQPQMGGEMGMPQMNEQQALETIIQLLIEQGIPPEQALELAAQILQIFAQGGEPAVEAFANQLEQQEQVQEMAGGGIAGLYPRQGYFVGKIVKSVGKVVKSVAKAVKSVAKSPIGRLALTIGANMLLPGAGTAFGAALQSAAVNLGLQVVGGGKINPLEALAAGASGYFGYTPSANAATNVATSTVDGVNATTKLLESQGVMANPNLIPADSALKGLVAESGPGFLPETIRVQDAFPSLRGQVSPTATLASQAGTTIKPTGILQTAQNKIGEFFTSPLDTVKKLGTSALDYAQKEPGTALAIAGGVGLAGGLGLSEPKRDDESDDEYAQRLQKASPYLRQYYMNLNPGATPGQIEQFVTQNTAEYRADGGIIGYAKGGSMVPPARQIEGGIIELDARKTGGYIPYGKKERVDDVPAMLAKDEFVFTSRAVKAAGGGSAKRGAAKMYALMKQLESKGKKMERGARA